jgi:hypothetical protein
VWASGIPPLLCCLSRGLRFLGEYVPEAIEPALPQRAALGDPLCSNVEPGGLEATDSHAANFVCADDLAALEHLEVLNDCRQGDAERLRQVAGRRRTVAQLLDELPARGVAECVEDLVDMARLGGCSAQSLENRL